MNKQLAKKEVRMRRVSEKVSPTINIRAVTN
jgi:hypothetical protein